MMIIAPSPSHCGVVVEGNRRSQIAQALHRPERHLLRNKVADLGGLMSGIVDRPQEVALVIAADYTVSYEAHSPAGEPASLWGEAFKTGAASTSENSDSVVTVLLNSNQLAPLISGTMTQREHIALDQIIVHEAQHVLQFQRGSWGGVEDATVFDPYTTMLVDIAATMCDEYSADWHVIRTTGLVRTVDVDVVMTLNELDLALAAACASFRIDHDFHRLCVAVISACADLWLGVTYWASLYGAMAARIPPALNHDPLWRKYVHNTWREAVEVLHQLPVADLTCQPHEFDTAVDGLLQVMHRSLKRICQMLVL